MKPKRNLIQVCRLLPALWLVVGLGLCSFPAGKAQAQVVVTSADGFFQNESAASGVSNVIYGSVQVPANVSTNINTQVVGAGASASASCSVTSQILPLQFTCTNLASASSDLNSIHGDDVAGYASSAFGVQFNVTVPVRFTLAASANVSLNGNTAGSLGFYELLFLDQNGSVIINIQQYVSLSGSDSVVTNVSGIFLPGGSCSFTSEAWVQEEAAFDTPGTQTGNATASFQITFDPLPAGDNEILGGLLSGGDMRFTYVGIAGTNYVLERTFNLSPPVNWVPQLINLADSSGVLIFTNTPNKGTNNFWRIRSVP